VCSSDLRTHLDQLLQEAVPAVGEQGLVLTHAAAFSAGQEKKRIKLCPVYFLFFSHCNVSPLFINLYGLMIFLCTNTFYLFSIAKTKFLLFVILV